MTKFFIHKCRCVNTVPSWKALKNEILLICQSIKKVNTAPEKKLFHIMCD